MTRGGQVRLRARAHRRRLTPVDAGMVPRGGGERRGGRARREGQPDAEHLLSLPAWGDAARGDRDLGDRDLGGRETWG